MTKGTKKLKQDLDILKSMVEELSNYLSSDVLYWPMFKASYPKMTLGGYLMRQRRLQILSYLLDQAEQTVLERAVLQFDETTINKIAILNQKGNQEIQIRINQWQDHMQEYRESGVISKEYYATDAEGRTMITDLVSKFGSQPYLLDEKLIDQVDKLDNQLAAIWHEGDFIWHEEWSPAYGKSDFWWLYGTPRIPENN